MDRSLIQKEIVFRHFSKALIIFYLLFGVIDLAAQEAKEQHPRARKKSVPEGIETGVVVYYGNLIQVDIKKRFIYLEPIDRRLSRMLFYIDSRTGYVKDGYAAKLSDLKLNDKLAVRYLLYGNLKIAEEVFVVDGEFEPNRYRKRNVKRRSKVVAPVK